jgi:CheY-like chemotaxis protein
MSKNGASILVVDDEKEILRALSRSLTAHGYTVSLFPASAIASARRPRPDFLTTFYIYRRRGWSIFPAIAAGQDAS